MAKDRFEKRTAGVAAPTVNTDGKVQTMETKSSTGPETVNPEMTLRDLVSNAADAKFHGEQARKIMVAMESEGTSSEDIAKAKEHFRHLKHIGTEGLRNVEAVLSQLPPRQNVRRNAHVEPLFREALNTFSGGAQ